MFPTVISSSFLFFFPEFGFSSLTHLQFAIFALLSFLIFAFFFSPGGLAWAFSKSPTRQAIPGPCGIPLLGQALTFSSSVPHQILANLAKRFHSFPLMAFSIGFTRFVVSSNPETSKEMLCNAAFADRPLKESAYQLLFDRAMGFAPYGEYWKNLRRIASTHLFSPRRIVSFEGIRREVGDKMVDQIKSLMNENGEVKVKNVLHFGSLNNVMMTVFGKKYDFVKDQEGVELEDLVREGYELLSIFNWSDHFPLVRWLDIQGVRRRCKRLVFKVNSFVERIIEERKRQRGTKNSDLTANFVDVLLDLDEEYKLSDSDTIAVLWEMIFRGTDTVAILLEWILARMVLHPEIQAKAQAEIDEVAGTASVSDSDIPKLHYLQSIVKETLRLHPPGPLLSWARLAVRDVHIGNYFIPKGTIAMVNMWAITHDDRIWSRPEEFAPERFEEEDVSILGSDLTLAPFGSGRRVCPGKSMGLASVHLWIAKLLQKFKWVPSENGVDLSECLKLSMEMKNPLVCKAILRCNHEQD